MKVKSLDAEMKKLVVFAGLGQVNCSGCGCLLEAYRRDPDDGYAPAGGWRCSDCGGNVAKAKGQPS